MSFFSCFAFWSKEFSSYVHSYLRVIWRARKKNSYSQVQQAFIAWSVKCFLYGWPCVFLFDVEENLWSILFFRHSPTVDLDEVPCLWNGPLWYCIFPSFVRTCVWQCSPVCPAMKTDSLHVWKLFSSTPMCLVPIFTVRPNARSQCWVTNLNLLGKSIGHLLTTVTSFESLDSYSLRVQDKQNLHS